MNLQTKSYICRTVVPLSQCVMFNLTSTVLESHMIVVCTCRCISLHGLPTVNVLFCNSYMICIVHVNMYMYITMFIVLSGITVSS